MIERDTPERGPQSNADPRRSVNWTEFLAVFQQLLYYSKISKHR
jgi:hypothetical protein